MKTALTILYALLSLSVAKAESDPNEITTWDRIVCIQSRVESKPDTGKLCSAFFVIDNNSLFLVTAGHASAETNSKSRIRYRDPSGKSQWVTLNSFFRESGNPWVRNHVSDLAIAKLPEVDGTETYREHFRALAIPLDSISIDTPIRTTQIVTAGFPLAIGAKDDISPVAVVGHIATRETVANNSWGDEPIIFFSPALAQGTSGGPAFLHAENGGDLTVVGMYIGVVNDASGAKLSKMVPSRIIRESISHIQTGG